MRMAFVSAAFVAFMVAVGLVYFAVPKRVRWVVLLVASYVFFFLNSQWLIAVIFVQTLATYACGALMARVDAKLEAESEGDELDKKSQRALKAAGRKKKKRWMGVGVFVNLGALLFLKYYNFFADNANVLLQLLGIELPSLGLVVPIGLSFYTLQAIAYLVDVQRGKIEADSSLPKFMLFMSYFPQILQGPIPRHAQLAHQLYEGHAFDYRRLRFGAQLIVWGFIKKLVIADRLAIPVNQVFDNWGYYDGLILFLAAAGYGLQVYADFSGGVDIARGFSQAIGIDMVDNFNQPYFSKSIEGFWRRWHMTLGQWMRDYVFYPLSLSKGFSKLGKRSRKLLGPSAGKKIPPFIAMFIVYFCVGFWHGANWTFIAYGIWNGVFIMFGILLEDRYAAARNALHVDENSFSWEFFQMVRTFFLCAIGRFFSRADTLSQALGMIKGALPGLLDWSCVVDGSLLQLGLDTANWVVLLLAVLVLLMVDIAHERGFKIREAIAGQGIVFRWVVYLAAFSVALVFGVYGVGFDSAAFIYQQF